jgi:hypothetical protein
MENPIFGIMKAEKSFKQLLTQTSLVAAIVLVTLWLVVYFVGYYYYANGYLLLSVLACFGFIGYKAFKNKNEIVNFDFGKAFQFVLTAYVVAALIKSIFLFFLLNFWDPNLSEYLYQIDKKATEQQIIADKIPKEFQQKLFEQVENNRYFTPTVLFQEFVGELTYAAIISAIIAYFVKSKKASNPELTNIESFFKKNE